MYELMRFINRARVTGANSLVGTIKFAYDASMRSAKSRTTNSPAVVTVITMICVTILLRTMGMAHRTGAAGMKPIAVGI